jgi:hypothetical protein
LSVRKRAVLLFTGVFLAYALLALAMTWPVVARLSTHLVGDGDDMWVHYWNGWWVKRVLQQGGDIYYTPLLFHPTGVSLLYHNFAWVNIALWLALEPAVGGIVAYNLVYLIHLPLCGLGLFALARRLTGSSWIAFLCGLIYAFWPHRMLEVDHPNMISTEGLPFLMLTLLYLVESDRPIRYGVIAGLLTALIGYMRWQLVILAGFMTALYLLYTLIWRRERWSWRMAGGLALVAAIAAALMAPGLFPLVRGQLTGGVPEEAYDVAFETDKQDAANYLLPQHQHLLSPLYDRVLTSYAATAARVRCSAFLGHIVIGLVVVGVVKRRRSGETWLWVGLALSCFTLALGPYLRFNGVRYTNLRLPYQLIGWLPPVQLLGPPRRFNALLALPVAILAGYGASAFREWLARRRWGARLARPAVFTGLMGVLLLLDYLSIPTATVPARVPAFYSSLAEEPGDFAIVGFPGKRAHTEYYMFYQTVHSRPILGGHVSSSPSEALTFMSSVPLIKGMYKDGLPDTSLPDVSRQLAMLAEAGFRYIVVHKALASPEQVAGWRSYLVIAPYYEDEEVVVYSTSPVVGRDCPLWYDLGAGMGVVEARLSVETVRPGDKLEVEVVWGTTAPPGADYQVELALVDEEGREGQMQRFELSPGWPSGEWPVDAIVRGKYVLGVDTWLNGGRYAVVLRLVRDGLPVGQGVKVGEVEMQLPERSFVVPAMSHETGAAFGEDLRLLGYDLETEADSLRITLHWQALRRMGESYTMFVHVFDPATGEIVGQADVMAYGFTYPTAWWEAGEVVSDEAVVAGAGVPAGAAGGAVGVYNADTGDRLAISGQLPAFVVDDNRLILPEEVVR